MKHVTTLLVTLCAAALHWPSVPAAAQAAPGDAAKVDEPLPPERAQALLDQLRRAQEGTTTLRASFVQHAEVAVLDEPLVSRGQLLFRAPDQVRFDVHDPFRAVTVLAGDHYAEYERTNGDWRRLSTPGTELGSAVLRQIAAWIAGGPVHEEGFVFSAYGDPQPRLRLTPSAAAIRRAVQWIELTLAPDASRVLAVQVLQAGGDRVTLTFPAERRGEDLPANLFGTQAPAPVEPDLPPLAPPANHESAP